MTQNIVWLLCHRRASYYCACWLGRSAREAEEREKQAISKGETLPTEKRFDSNCITPGTSALSTVLVPVVAVIVIYHDIRKLSFTRKH